MGSLFDQRDSDDEDLDPVQLLRKRNDDFLRKHPGAADRTPPRRLRQPGRPSKRSIALSAINSSFDEDILPRPAQHSTDQTPVADTSQSQKTVPNMQKVDRASPRKIKRARKISNHLLDRLDAAIADGDETSATLEDKWSREGGMCNHGGRIRALIARERQQFIDLADDSKDECGTHTTTRGLVEEDSCRPSPSGRGAGGHAMGSGTVPPGKICLKFQTPHGDAPFLVPRGTPLLSILDKIRDKLLEKGVLRGAEDGPLEKLRLQFDGDEVEAGDTPDSLDMEDDNVVDCLW